MSVTNIGDYKWSVMGIHKDDSTQIAPCLVRAVERRGNYIVITAELPPKPNVSSFIPTMQYYTQTRGVEEK